MAVVCETMLDSLNSGKFDGAPPPKAGLGMVAVHTTQENDLLIAKLIASHSSL